MVTRSCTTKAVDWSELRRFSNDFSKARQLSTFFEAYFEAHPRATQITGLLCSLRVLRNEDWSLDKLSLSFNLLPLSQLPSTSQLDKHNMPRKGSKRRKNRTHIKPAPNAAPDTSTSSKVPKSFVVKSGTVGNSVAQLTKDVRKVLEPNTGTRLRVSRYFFQLESWISKSLFNSSPLACRNVNRIEFVIMYPCLVL